MANDQKVNESRVWVVRIDEHGVPTSAPSRLSDMGGPRGSTAAREVRKALEAGDESGSVAVLEVEHQFWTERGIR